jgi:hypothetical protein
MINEKYKYSELTGKIIGCARKISEINKSTQSAVYFTFAPCKKSESSAEGNWEECCCRQLPTTLWRPM